MSDKRKGQHKPGLLLESQTERRRTRASEVRAAKREGALAKRRRSVPLSSNADAAEDDSRSSYAYSEAELAEALAGVCGTAAASSGLPHLIKLRKMLASEDPPVDAVIAAQAVPQLLQLLQHSDDRYKTETVRCLANIGSGDKQQTSHILEGAPVLLGFLSAPSAALQEEALYALGNIAGDVQECRDMLIAQGAIPAILKVLTASSSSGSSSSSSSTLTSTAAWALANLTRGAQTSALPFQAAGCFPVLVSLLRDPNEEVAAEAAWSLAFLTAREDQCVVTLLSLGLPSALMDLLVRGNGRTTLCTPALRALGNLAAGPDEWVVTLLQQAQFLPCLNAIVQSQETEHHALVKEAAWAVSNVAGGHPACREAVVQGGFLAPLLDLLRSGQFDIQREAAGAVWNLVADGQLLEQVVRQPGVLQAFITLLKVPDMSVVRVALSFVRLVCCTLKDGAMMVENAGGIEAIDELHYGNVEASLSHEAALIIDRFFGEDYGGSLDGGVMSNTGIAYPAADTSFTAVTAAPAGSMGRGKAMVTPSWMKNASSSSSSTAAQGAAAAAGSAM